MLGARRLALSLPPLGSLFGTLVDATFHSGNEMEDVNRQGRPGSCAVRRRSPRLVLVASPNAALIDQISERVRKAGCVACCARSAAGCLRVATAVAPDVVLLDAAFPQAFERMLRSHPSTAAAEVLRLSASIVSGQPPRRLTNNPKIIYRRAVWCLNELLLLWRRSVTRRCTEEGQLR
jgi:CheY-like chemotaxis protein